MEVALFVPRWRSPCRRGSLCPGVAIAAVQPELSNVELMAVGDWLLGHVAYVSEPRGEVVPDRGDHRESGDWPDDPESDVTTDPQFSGPHRHEVLSMLVSNAVNQLHTGKISDSSS